MLETYEQYHQVFPPEQKSRPKPIGWGGILLSDLSGPRAT